ncbi:MAG: ABC transporter permease [Actinomycetales bacterium]|nr:MAG: ABC transporter permease [bacterium TMED264]PQM61883.1 MAG: ABC transporter permease [Actinomycetales bacterium]|tara:strand:- start:2173 stop:3060 length:888 start_codon:yes stop_codon:yes gene_type:complete
MTKLFNKKNFTIFVFTSPWVLGFLSFGIYPIIISFYYSLCQYDVLREPMFIGLENYRIILYEDAYFWKTIWNTLYYTIFRVPINIFLSLLIAILLNRTLKASGLIRATFFLPSLISGVALSVIWIWIFNPQIGLLNTILAFFGLKGPLWLQDENWSKLSLVIMSTWSIGGGRMLVFLAALQNVNPNLYEALKLDGGNDLQCFWHITLPLISPVIFLWSVIEVIASMQIFTEAFIMTKGGPLESTLFYNLYLYNQAFENFNMGYASALAWILLVITLIITIAQFRLSKKYVYYDNI